MSSTTFTEERERTSALARQFVEHGLHTADVALVLGSGLGPLADAIEDATEIPYASLEHMPQSKVPGHAGKLVSGRLEGKHVVCQKGRVHLYEGWSAAEVTRCVRALAEAGVPKLILTNAAGGLNRDWRPGALMLLTDHVNAQGVGALPPGEASVGSVYDEELMAILRDAASREAIDLVEGVYVALQGPTYETPAEIRLLARAGAGAVGMSTAQEAAAAAHRGMRVAAVSCITNMAAGISDEPPNHEEVVREGKLAAERFTRLLKTAVANL